MLAMQKKCIFANVGRARYVFEINQNRMHSSVSRILRENIENFLLLFVVFCCCFFWPHLSFCILYFYSIITVLLSIILSLINYILSIYFYLLQISQSYFVFCIYSSSSLFISPYNSDISLSLYHTSLCLYLLNYLCLYLILSVSILLQLSDNSLEISLYLPPHSSLKSYLSEFTSYLPITMISHSISILPYNCDISLRLFINSSLVYK